MSAQKIVQQQKIERMPQHRGSLKMWFFLMSGFDERFPRAKSSIVMHAGYRSWGTRHSQAIEAMVRVGYALPIQRQTRYGVVDEYVLTHRGRVARNMLGVTNLDWEAAVLTADQAPVFLLR